MVTYEDLVGIHKNRNGRGLIHKHDIVSAKSLAHVAYFLNARGIEAQVDYTQPYHIVTTNTKPKVSIYDSGFGNGICILPLRKNGSPWDPRYEVGRATPEGAANYVAKKYFKKESKIGE